MLTTQNVPLITRILTIPWEKSPFQASVYFFGKQTFLDQKWGTPQPIPLRDARFWRMVQLRANGKYSFRIVDSPLLLNTLVGTQGQIHDRASRLVPQRRRRFPPPRFCWARSAWAVLDLQSKGNEIEAGAKAKVADDFGKYGLELVDFIINAITPPDDVQEAINARSRIGALEGCKPSPCIRPPTAWLSWPSKAAKVSALAPWAWEWRRFRHDVPRHVAASHARHAATAAAQMQPMAPPVAAGAAPAFAQAAATQSMVADPKQLVRGVSQSNSWQVTESGDQWQIVVPVGPLRKQKVNVQFTPKTPKAIPCWPSAPSADPRPVRTPWSC